MPEIKPIVEVGCGKGNISRVINPDLCIEIDKKFIYYLRDFNLILADARFLPVLRGQIISSLPYYITYDFMLEISSLPKIRYLVLILQKDFVYKIINKPTFISYLLNYYYKINLIKIIPPSYFEPKPKVFSALVTMSRIRENRNLKVEEILRCLSRYKNKSLRRASKLCGVNSNEDKKVEEYRPWEVIELLNSVGLEYV